MKSIYPSYFDRLNAIADGRDHITISGLVVGSTITVDGPETQKIIEPDEDELKLTFDQAGRFQIRLLHPDYLTVSYTAIARAPPEGD